MKKWAIEFWLDSVGKCPVERWLDNLDQEHAKSVAKELELLELAGNQLKLPHSKPLKKGLFELRERRFGYRIYYCFNTKLQEIIILLASGDKSTQVHDIEIARKRLLKPTYAKGKYEKKKLSKLPRKKI